MFANFAEFANFVLIFLVDLPFIDKTKPNIETMNEFGTKIRELREKQNLFLRQVASVLEMDTAQLSKIEKGTRQLKREQIPVIAEILKSDKEELLTLWLADQVMEVLNGEPLADEALKTVAKKRKQSK